MVDYVDVILTLARSSDLIYPVRFRRRDCDVISPARLHGFLQRFCFLAVLFPIAPYFPISPVILHLHPVFQFLWRFSFSVSITFSFSWKGEALLGRVCDRRLDCGGVRVLNRGLNPGFGFGLGDLGTSRWWSPPLPEADFRRFCFQLQLAGSKKTIKYI
uniref:Transmembrane protein n=1 Tax=Medicago truncatula TaxID=3880 RepID=A2Q4H2_MEDTR|nr:hypothetical protein MtrDRAFT_AC157488g5v2 [Medicago truncatula]